MGSLGAHGPSKKSPMWHYPKVLGFNPPKRWGHSACFSRGAVYVFGGCCGGLLFSDVLMLDLNMMVWSTLATTGQGPGPRDSHSAVLVGQKMIVFGGTNGSKKLNDLHILDLGSKEWIRPECKGIPPSPRESHTATLVRDDKMVIFGGSGEDEASNLNDFHVLDLKTMVWTSPPVNGEIPVPRDSHSSNVIANKLFVYGGDCGDRYHGGVDMLDMRTFTWSRLVVQGPSPGVRAGHVAVNVGSKVYIIGGVGDKHYYNDVWILDVCTCLWTQLEICGQQPEGRFSHTAVVTDSDIVIYGGCGEDERPLNELLILHLGSDHPDSRYNISMCRIFDSHWSRARQKFPGEADENLKTMFFGAVRKGAIEPEIQPKQSFQFSSDTLHSKKRRASNPATLWEIESEQEEHSLSLSQHSSPSQFNREQTPVRKAPESIMGSQGFNLFKHLKQVPNNSQLSSIASNHKDSRNMIQRIPQDHQFLREHQNNKKPDHLNVVQTSQQGTQYSTVELKPMEAGPSIHNLIGADVHGKVDGAFDSGFLMTATVHGKIFRGVLFPPGPGSVSRGLRIAQTPSSISHIVVQPSPNSNPVEPFKSCQQTNGLSIPESGQSYRQAQESSHFPVIRASPPPSLGKEPKLRSDLQGVVLTLGGPGTGVS